MKDGKPMYTYNFVGLEETTIAGSDKVAPGKATIVMQFDYEGGRRKGGPVTLSVNGKQVGTGRLTRTEPNAFSADDLADVGVDEATPVAKAYTEHTSKFTGRIHSVRVNIK